MTGIKIIIQKLEVDGEEHGTVVKVFMAWKSIIGGGMMQH